MKMVRPTHEGAK